MRTNHRRLLFCGDKKVPCGICLLGKGLTINGLRYSGSYPFPQTPIPLMFFDVPGLRYSGSYPFPHPVDVFRCALPYDGTADMAGVT